MVRDDDDDDDDDDDADHSAANWHLVMRCSRNLTSQRDGDSAYSLAARSAREVAFSAATE